MQYNFRKAILSLLAVSLFLLGCEKKEIQEEVKTNYFSVDEMEYDLSSGFFANYGYDSEVDSYGIFLFLLSDGFTLTSDNGDLVTFEGAGDLIGVELSTGTNDLTTGTYTFNENFSEGTFSSGGVFFNYDVDDDDNGLDFGFVGGTITVLKESSIYTISLSLDLENAENGVFSTLTGSYTGELSILDLEGLFAKSLGKSGTLAKSGFRTK